MDFIEIVKDAQAFALTTFKESTAISSLTHLQKEIGELEFDLLFKDLGEPEQRAAAVIEYADCFLCLISSSAFAGVSIEEIINAIQVKVAINKKRRWVLNYDKTYIHVKGDTENID